MKDYTISETFTIPTHGKIYEQDAPAEITLKSMQTRHEMMRLSPTDFPYQNLCNIIDDCMVMDYPISSYDMYIGDYQFLLFKLREVTYGKNYKMGFTCPYCGESTTTTVDLDSLEIKEIDSNLDDFEKYLTCKLPCSGKEIKLNYQTPRMVDRIVDQVKRFRKKSNGQADDATIIFTVCNLINTIDGKKVDMVKLEEFVRNLPMGDTNTILNYADKLNDLYGVNTTTEAKCAVCGILNTVKIHSDNEFFRPALDI